ncbi:MAG: ATP-binding protein [Acidobacteria bacterium]|nr:ATP-binding protein [Acidobacteriota bacterium]
MTNRLGRRCAFIVLGFSAGLQARQLPVRIYTTADGLASNQVGHILQDSRGFLWFSTVEGLSRFDGYRFVTYGPPHGLPNRRVTMTLESRGGNLWAGTTGGLCRFHPEGAAHAKFSLHRPGDGDASWITVLLQARDGTIYVGTKAGLYRLAEEWAQPPRFERMEIPDMDPFVTALLEDRYGALWIGTRGELTRWQRDGRRGRFTAADGLLGNTVPSLLEDREGKIWVASYEGGVALLRNSAAAGRPVVERVYTTRDGIASPRVEAISQLRDGRFWLGTNGGLTELLPQAAGLPPALESFTAGNGLAENGITSLAEDREGNVWIATESSGVMKIARSGFTSYTERDGLPNTRIRGFSEDRAGGLHVITHQIRISRFDGRRFTTVLPNLPEGIANLGWGWTQTTFQDHAGEWWVATGQGLARYPRAPRLEALARQRPAAIYTTRDGLADNNVFRLFEDSRGDIWIGLDEYRGPLSRWERSTGSFHRIPEVDALSAKAGVPTAFCEDRNGDVWMGFYYGGVARYRGGRLTYFGEDHGVPLGVVSALYLDPGGRLWIAAGRGLARADTPQTAQPAFTTYTTEQGLSGNACSCITGDRWGRIYVGTSRGVDRLNPSPAGIGQIKHYTTADGLARGQCTAAHRDRRGWLWFGTLQGLSVLAPEPDRPRPPPPIWIGGLRVAGAPRPVSDLGQTEVPSLVLAAGQNHLEIDFFGVSFFAGENLRYQYRLEDADTDWRPPTEQRTVNYASLSPGSYRFQVRAVGNDGVVSSRPATVAFRIPPPVWRRAWFLALAAIAFAALVYAAHRYRVGQLVAIERVRTRIASDLHDDIGSSLSRIALLSEVVQRGWDGGSRNGSLAKIAAISRETVRSMSDIVWAIDPEQDTLSALIHRMRRFAGDLLAPSDIELRFRAAPVAGEIGLDADLRRQVFLIFKEALHNALRHSGAAAVEVEIGASGGWLTLLVRDHGRGFDPASAPAGQGLASMRRRAQDLGGALEIGPEAAGASVRLAIPLAHRSAPRWRRLLHL